LFIYKLPGFTTDCEGYRKFTNSWPKKKAVLFAGKPRDAAVIFQDGGRLPSWI